MKPVPAGTPSPSKQGATSPDIRAIDRAIRALQRKRARLKHELVLYQRQQNHRAASA